MVGLGDLVVAQRDAGEGLGPGEAVRGGREAVLGAQGQHGRLGAVLVLDEGAVRVQPANDLVAVHLGDGELDGAVGDLIGGHVAAEGLGDPQVAGRGGLLLIHKVCAFGIHCAVKYVKVLACILRNLDGNRDSASIIS